MAYVKIPEKDAVLLIRALGLLISQASVYGPSHKVTQNAARSVFTELEQAVRAYGVIEIALNERQLLVNGSSDGITEAAGKNLSERMTLHKIGGLLFQAPAVLDEFLTCVTLLGTPPAALAAENGFEGAVRKAGLRSVQVVTVAFQRVAGEKEEKTGDLSGAPVPADPQAAANRPRPAAGGVAVLDLSEALAMDDAPETPHTAPDTRAAKRKEQSASLASLLRETAALLEQDEGPSAEKRHQTVIDTLERIRHVLSTLTVDSEHHISSLANQVDDDRQTIASIESAARRRGIGLKLTRAELIERYAELNQEIVQPLTVSTGVIGMLQSERAGVLTSSQRDLLKMAEESVGRVNQLVAYMSRISGLPESYTPDSQIISESYR
ncbi:MAG: hypothetical protein RBT78_00980 [Kiritimatiellia bacterium]|jgi:hypothetical protein|nr:hypothetical protein [Kiritimatiellia bacterium]